MHLLFLDLNPCRAVVGAYFSSLAAHNLAIVGHNLAGTGIRSFALRQRTRPNFTVFTFFLHFPYKIAKSIPRSEKSISSAYYCAFESWVRVLDLVADTVTAESKESHFVVNIAIYKDRERSAPSSLPPVAETSRSGLRLGGFQLSDCMVKKTIDIVY